MAKRARLLEFYRGVVIFFWFCDTFFLISSGEKGHVFSNLYRGVVVSYGFVTYFTLISSGEKGKFV